MWGTFLFFGVRERVEGKRTAISPETKVEVKVSGVPFAANRDFSSLYEYKTSFFDYEIITQIGNIKFCPKLKNPPEVRQITFIIFKSILWFWSLSHVI